MTKNKSKPPLGEFDLISPFIEIAEDLFKILGNIFLVFGKKAFIKIFNKDPEFSKLEPKALKVKKNTNSMRSLGIDNITKKEILLSSIEFKRHSFIVGASGFGKTNLISILQENALRLNKPIIFIDPKGDLEAMMDFKNLCEKYHKKCHIFSEHYPYSIKLNPFKDGTNNQISERIMNAFDWTEQYYRDASEDSLLEALETIRKSNKTVTIENILGYLKTERTKDNSGLIVKLKKIFQSDFGKLLSDENGLTLQNIRDSRDCLYIGLSVQGYRETAKALGKIFLNELLYNSYTSLISNSSDSESKKNPISVFYDEFGAVVNQDFIELQNKCRGAGMELTVAVQTIADLTAVSEDLAIQIIENSNNMFILKQRTPKSAEFFSQMIGTILSKKRTHRVEGDEKQDTASEREAYEMIVHPDIIKNLGIGQCILLKQVPKGIHLINIRNRGEDKNNQTASKDTEIKINPNRVSEEEIK